MKKLLLSVFISASLANPVFGIDLIINGKKFYINEYQISDDGMEIKINHQIDMPTDCSPKQNKDKIRRTPSGASQAHRNPNRRISIIQRFMNDLSTIRETKRKTHQ